MHVGINLPKIEGGPTIFPMIPLVRYHTTWFQKACSMCYGYPLQDMAVSPSTWHPEEGQ